MTLAERGLRLTAFRVAPNCGFKLEPAPVRRDWMDAFPHKWPYRCLPMSIANQAGWIVRCPVNVKIRWNGKQRQDGLKIELPEDASDIARASILSFFGGGIVTFRLPWIFRTDPGIGIWVHGAPNEPTDAIQALEGIVESEWDVNGFTMNWKVTRRNTDVFFRAGDPILMMTPYPLALLEAFEPDIRPVDDDPEFARAVREAHKSRQGAVQANVEREQAERDGGEDAGAGSSKPIWEKRYMSGELPDGTKAPEHRTNFKLNPFTRRK